MENKKTKVAWVPAADAAFIDLWEEKAEELRGPRKNSHIYAEMAESLAVYKCGIRPVDVKYKIHNFTMKYRKCKAGQGTGSSPVSWKFFDQVHRIIGNDRINNVEAVVTDSITDMPQPLSPSDSPSPSPSSSSIPNIASPEYPSPLSLSVSDVSMPGGKTTKNQKLNELNETIKTAMAENNKLTAELIELEKKKVAAIETLSQSVVSFLERN